MIGTAILHYYRRQNWRAELAQRKGLREQFRARRELEQQRKDAARMSYLEDLHTMHGGMDIIGGYDPDDPPPLVDEAYLDDPLPAMCKPSFTVAAAVFAEGTHNRRYSAAGRAEQKAQRAESEARARQFIEMKRDRLIAQQKQEAEMGEEA